MEHYITKIYIEQVRHLKDIQIELNKEKRQHLILTGKNGSGKTSVLEALRSFLEMIQNGIKALSSGVFAQFSDGNIHSCYLEGTFITAYFSASRTTEISLPRGVEEVQLKNVYGMEENPTTDLLKYMVHLKTQQIYAKNEGDADTESRIEDWFQQFEDALRTGQTHE
ncbi:MAG: AAA family ATPase [Lachnospiraceae bacterium]|nr:AAA family ATPase [Lachnospiraceae bacterium]